MKKTLIYSMMLFSSVSVFAQDVANGGSSFKSKNGHEVLPQAGEWAIGVSATSALTYFGNAFNGATANNNAPVFGYANNPNYQIFGGLPAPIFFGKYMVDANTAYRVKFQLNYNATTNNGYVLKNAVIQNVLLPEFVEDKQNLSNTTVVIGGGIEKRRGSGRLQGIYGGEVLLGYTSGNTDYSYGNALEISFPSANTTNTTNFGSNLVGGLAGSRLLEEKFSNRFLVGARGFIGVEYFVAPKISLGGEVGYTLGFQTRGKNYKLYEVMDQGALQTVKVEDRTGQGQLRAWGLGLDNASAGINLNFYF